MSTKILLDKEYLQTKKELVTLKKSIMCPHVIYESESQWKELCHTSLDALASGLRNYIRPNIIQDTSIIIDYNLPLSIPRLQSEINNLLCICLEQITQNSSWSNRKAKEISTNIGIAFAAFGNGIGMDPNFVDNLYTQGHCHNILNYIMKYILCSIDDLNISLT